MSLVSGDMDGGHGVAAAYINYLYTPLPQDIVSKHFFRPRDEHVSAGYANRFPRLELFTIDDVFGGWQKAQKMHFPRVEFSSRSRAIESDTVPALPVSLAHSRFVDLFSFLAF
ncbi:hypothetical protein [Nitrosospira sp. Nsp18]|uniref:hypothetical protein n=1 Tax=Nitrosospira sp. Nsp18 TaxID=1855334 RepID=UPI000B837057|nr:hypothetical protein [Nitrosospira sp. Nsp18]